MKPVVVESSLRSDRFATLSEVISAISIMSHAAQVPGGSYNDLRETDSGLRGGTRNLPEGEMWLAIVRALPDFKSN
jgi:hypothetical protein